jgi:WD40 repeat protein
MRYTLSTLTLLAVISMLANFSGQAPPSLLAVDFPDAAVSGKQAREQLLNGLPAQTRTNADTVPEEAGPAVSSPRLVSQLGHAGASGTMAFSPDGRYVVTGSGDGTVRLWHTETGLELRTLDLVSLYGQDASLVGPVFSPSGKEIATGGPANYASLWDVATGREIGRFSGHQDMVGAVAFSADGRYLLTGSADGSTALWDRDQPSPLQVFSGGFSADFVGFSFDGRYVVTAGSAFQGAVAEHDVLVIWSISGEERFRLAWDSTFLRDVAISEVAPLLAVVTNDKTVTLVSLESGQAVGELHEPGVTAVAFLQDGRHLVTANGQSATLWSLVSRQPIRRLIATGHGPTVVAASRDGRYVLTGGNDRTARVWAVDSGIERRRLEGKAAGTNALAFSPNGQTLYTATPLQSISAWSLASGKVTSTFQPRADPAAVVFSMDGKYAALVSSGRVTVVSPATGKEIQHINGSFETHTPMAFSPDGTELTAIDHGPLTPQGGYAPRLRKWSVVNGQELQETRLQNAIFSGVAYSPDGRYMAMSYDTFNVSGLPPHDGRARVFKLDLGAPGTLDVQSKIVLVELLTNQQIEMAGEFITSLAFSSNGQLLATGHIDGITRVWSVRDGREVLRLGAHLDAVRAVAFFPSGQLLATGSADLTRLWDVGQGREIARLLSPTPDAWTVVDLGGRFDSYDLETVQGLHWVMPDDPMTPLPVEIFMRNYYEPRLLPRVLAGEKLPEIPSLVTLNRAQPQVEIVAIEADVAGSTDRPTGAATLRLDASSAGVCAGSFGVGSESDQGVDTVSVTVEVSGSRSEFGLDEHKRVMETGVYDLRLYRDGQLVRQCPAAMEDSAEPGKSREEERAHWRSTREVVDAQSGKKQITFSVIPLPRRAGVTEVEFSAYAFNVDRVKSETARKKFEMPATLPPRLGKAYVITMGVNAFEKPHLDLSYAANDARAMGSTLWNRLRATYEDAVWVSLISDAKKDATGNREMTVNDATKDKLKAVLEVLAGKKIDRQRLRGVPNAEHLHRAYPEDLVIIALSTHGDVDSRGRFYIVPHDIGPGDAQGDAMLQHAVSSEELSTWIREIDAQDMVMIVDACRSEASVKSQDFKPGPMGDRGLGQLAYDKGMRILAATQIDQYALETEKTKQGLLTYALVEDGLRQGKANFKPADDKITLSEWLTYGAERVPGLYQEWRECEEAKRHGTGECKLQARTAVPLDALPAEFLSLQQPALFDFTRNRDVVISGVVGL